MLIIDFFLLIWYYYQRIGESDLVNDTLVIDEANIEIAKGICCSIDDEATRNRALANAFAAKIAKDFFTNIDLDIESGLHNIPAILNYLDISDIYIKDNYLDVRVFFEGDIPSVPKSHYNKGILPLAYMFIRVDSSLSTGVVEGFLQPSKIDFLAESEEYCKIQIEDLIQFEELESILLTNKIEEQINIDQDLEIKLFEFLDENLSSYETDTVIRALLESKTLRLKLIDMSKAQSIFNFASKVSKDVEFDEDSLTLEDLLNESEEQVKNNPVTKFNNDNHAKEEPVNEQLEDLFEASITNEELESNIVKVGNRKKGIFLPIFLFLIISSAVAYFVYTNYFVNVGYSSNQKEIESKPARVENKNVVKQKAQVAMPVESIDNKKDSSVNEITENKNIENSTASIPMMEQNLGASITLTNLSVNWEVPASYTSNTSVQRYLVKLGKIIQLNLKTELLLLNKLPITNKIVLELEFDKSVGKFKIKNMVNSSGEKNIDKIIEQVVNTTLQLYIKSNMKIFENMTGNPSLVIRL